MKEKMFRTISVKDWWQEKGSAKIEWWIREGNNIEIISETIPFRQYMDLPYLYQEVKLNDIQLYKDE